MKHSILTSCIAVLSGAAAAGFLFVGCTEEVDNSYSRFQSVIEITASSQEIVLDEDAPDEVALTVTWTDAADYGSDFLTTYEYAWNLTESQVAEKTEYEDGGVFTRTYTNAELQEIMIDDFGYTTSTWGTMVFTVTASYEGSYIVLPDEASVTVRVKTYGPRQFAADRVFISGTAVGSEDVELTASETNSSLYVYNGNLSAGSFNFPVVYGDENNVIIPADGADVSVGDDAMDATVVGNDETLCSWVISDADSYRVTLNFSTRTVTVIKTADIMEIDNLYIAGDAVGSEEIEITRTLENEAVYAWKGELSAGSLYFPIYCQEENSLTMVPSNADSHDLDVTGSGNSFTTVSAISAAGRYWSISSAGTYRIVIDTDARTVTVYSEEYDLTGKTVIFDIVSGSAPAQNDFTLEITCLWIFGENHYYSGSQPPGEPYILTQSLANPRLFVYKGETLQSDNIKFLVTDNWNNEYAFGASSIRDQDVTAVLGERVSPLYGGQGDNRYAMFAIPDGTNYIELYVGSAQYDESENARGKTFELTDSYVIFDTK